MIQKRISVIANYDLRFSKQRHIFFNEPITNTAWVALSAIEICQSYMSAQYVPKSADDNFDNIKFFGVSTQFVVMFQKGNKY